VLFTIVDGMFMDPKSLLNSQYLQKLSLVF